MAITTREILARLAGAFRRWQTWGFIAIAVFCAMLAYYFVSGMFASETAPSAGQQQMIMKGIVGQAQKGQDLTWRFFADSTNTSPDGMVTTYFQATATYFLHGKPAYKLTAPKVQVDMRSQNYSADGGVHIWSIARAPSQDFKTDYAQWSQAGQSFSCPNAVRVSYDGVTLVTSRLSANLRTGETQFGKTSITSNGASVE
jgi:hypothetical protein